MLLNPAGSSEEERAVPTQDDFGGPVVPGRDDGAVMLVIERGAAEVHHSDGRALHAPLVPLLREGERSYQLINAELAPSLRG